MRKINLRDAFTRFDEAWSPRVAGTVNGVDVRLAKLRGEFLWHRHDDEDELFLVCEGELLMKLRDGEHVVGGGEMILIPRGTDHMPVARTPECHVLTVSPSALRNTGNVENERTLHRLPPLETR